MRKNISCLVCRSNSKGYLCKKCKKNPFRIEEFRNLMAREKSVKLFKKTYNSTYSEIFNKNTSKFWNKKLQEEPDLSKQDGMTKKRIRVTASFIPKDVKNVFDIGFGNGYIEEYLKKKRDIKLSGVDISEKAVEKISKKIKGDFKVGSIYKLDDGRKYDCVFALEVLEHIPPSKIFSVLENINKILKNKGLFILSVPMNEGLEDMSDNPSGHMRSYQREVLFLELEIAGFKVIEYKELYAFRDMYLLKSIISKFLTNRWKPNNIIVKAQKP